MRQSTHVPGRDNARVLNSQRRKDGHQVFSSEFLLGEVACKGTFDKEREKKNTKRAFVIL